MTASHLEFHVEERSMEVFLKAWLAKLLPEGCTFHVYSYSGKPAMLRKIGSRLEAYAAWIPAEYRIVVVVDRDEDCCKKLKQHMERICEEAGLRSRRAAGGQDWQVVTRIAIEELEAWYFGDWSAVCAAYPRVSNHIPRKSPYRDPDAIKSGTWETFERILQNHGYFKQGLAKMEAASTIGEYFDPRINSSRNFKVFRNAIAEATT